MPLGGFGLLSIFYVFLGIRFLFQFLPRRKEVFDHNYTAQDRSVVSQAAFFLLLPISVLLHELGHAVAIWLMGGKVLDYGFYVFAGYVSYDPRQFSDAQQWLIAFAGTLVNLILIAIALWFALFHKPPLRAAYSDLLIQFAFISGINALILYPVLDLASNLNGDWRQMYSSGVPSLTGVIIVVQGLALFLGYTLFRTDTWQQKIAARTGSPAIRMPGSASGRSAIHTAGVQTMPTAITNAVARVKSGWPLPIQVQPVPTTQGPAVALVWQEHDEPRAVLIAENTTGSVAIVTPTRSGDNVTYSPIQRWPDIPEEDELTMALRRAMEHVSRQGT